MISFSVIIPLYNKELSIEKTLRSVLAQSYSDFEIIVINDGSTDNSLAVVERIEDDRIKIVSIDNSGVSNARNKGLEYACNPFIVFLDADDLWYADCLSEFRYLIENYPDASVFCTSHSLSIKKIPSREKRYYVDNYYKATAESYARDVVALLCVGCVAVRRECFDYVGGFTGGMTHGEDLDMWERLAGRYVFAKSEVVTMEYRLDAENRSDKTRKKTSVKRVCRDLITDKYHKLDYGRFYFFYVYSNIIRMQNWKETFRILFEYGDWIALFVILLAKVKLKSKLPQS